MSYILRVKVEVVDEHGNVIEEEDLPPMESMSYNRKYATLEDAKRSFSHIFTALRVLGEVK